MRSLPFNRLLVLLVLLGVLVVAPAMAEGLPPLTHALTALPDRPSAPALKLPDLDEEPVSLATLRGKVVVVNFWATWCPPCRREMGSMERLHQALADKGVEILAVNVGEDADTVFSFLGTVEPSPEFPLLLDSAAATLAPWGVRGLPTTYIVDPQGRLVYRAVGGREFDHPSIVEAISRLLD